MKIKITRHLGKWTLNGKLYPDAAPDEQTFFNKFIQHMKLAKLCQN